MTKPLTDLRALVEKSGDADLLHEMIGFAAERLMDLEVGTKTGGITGPDGTLTTKTKIVWATLKGSVRTWRMKFHLCKMSQEPPCSQ